MKLITEQCENIQILTEEVSGNKNMYIEGIFLQGNIKNRNGRVYPLQTLSNEVTRYNNTFVEQNRAWGELDHPSSPTVKLKNAAIRTVSLKEDGNNFIGKALILGTPNGQIAKALIDSGGKVAVSSRGVGSLKESTEGNVVQEDFMLSTAADLVSDPSAPEAFVEGIMESFEWILDDDGRLIKQLKEDVFKATKSADPQLIERVIYNNTQKLIRKLSNI